MVSIGLTQNASFISEKCQNGLHFQKQRCVGGSYFKTVVYLFLWAMAKLQIMYFPIFGNELGWNRLYWTPSQAGCGAAAAWGRFKASLLLCALKTTVCAWTAAVE